MKFGDIKTRHIYNVIFDPVRYCEFDEKHLALVLKKNNDKQTFIVMPLTSEANGNGVNKVKVGSIESLPSSLRSNETYAVFNQIRTVNASRFISLKEGDSVTAVKINDELFLKLFNLGINDMTHDLNFDEKIILYKSNYEQNCVSKSVDLAYIILTLKTKIETIIKDNPKNPLVKDNKTKIEGLRLEIKETLNNISGYTLSANHIENGIDKILIDILH